MSRGKVMTKSTTIADLLTSSVKEVFKVIETELKVQSIPFIKKSDYIVTNIKSKYPLPMVCVHVDTVSILHPTLNDLVVNGDVISLHKKSLSSCLGADDRAGIWIALQLIKSHKENKTKFNFGFFDFEERGAKGSTGFAEENPLYEVSCFIGLDRADKKGPNVATYGYDNKELVGLFTDFGYVESSGTFSDCSNLSTFYDVPCVNLSVGYQREHSDMETLSISSMEGTLEVMREVIIPEEELVVEYNKYSKWYRNYASVPGNDYTSDYDYDLVEIVCDLCGTHDKLYIEQGMQVCGSCIQYGGIR